MAKTTKKKKDILTFAEEDYILPETKRPIKLLPHQKVILKDCFTKDKQGRFPYKTILYSCIKKSGKTEIEGLVGLWFALTEPAYNEIYFIANDLEQSQARGFKRASRVIESNPRLYIKPNRSNISFSNGTEIQAISSDYAGAAGGNQGLTLWDELWAYTSEASRRLWDELTPVPTRLNSIRFIATYAGFEGESELLWELNQLGFAGERKYTEEQLEEMNIPEIDKDALRYIWVNEEAGLYMYWDHIPRMPWQTEQYYAEQRKSLRPNAFRRLHQNEWVSAVTSYIPIEAWDACVNPNMSPALPGLQEKLFFGVDIGVKRDTTGVVAVYWDKESNKLKLANHKIWTPVGGETLDLEATIEAYLLDMQRHFNIGAVYYDPSQFVRSAQFLAGKGVPVHEYTQVPTNLTSMTQILFELIRGHNIEMYPSGELRKQNMDCVIIEGSRGMRIAKEKASQKIDVIVAMAMACQAAWDGAGIVSLPESQPEKVSTWNYGGPSLVEVEEGEGMRNKSRWRI